MIHKVTIPYVNVNDRSVLLQEWFVQEGDAVKVEQILCIVETSKVSLEILSERVGFIKGIRFKVGEEIPISSTLCYIVENMNVEIPPEDTQDFNEESIEPARVFQKEEKLFSMPAFPELKGRITQKALDLALKLGVDPSRIKLSGFIKESDILSCAPETSIHPSGLLSHSVPSSLEGKKWLFELNRRIGDDENFKELSSEVKQFIYKLCGARIGSKVRIERGSQLLANSIEIGDDVLIAANVQIEADKIVLEDGVRIGNCVRITTGYLHLGEGTVLAEETKVDLSGGKTKNSALITGRDCLFASDTYINTSRKVQIGDSVALSPRSQILTHSFWQSVLDGYYVNFNEVILENDCWIGINAIVMPGIKVGEGSIVLSNSLVVQNVAPFTAVGGSPARVLRKDLKKELTSEQKEDKVIELLIEFKDYISSWGHYVEHFTKDRIEIFNYRIDGKEERLVFVGSGVQLKSQLESDIIVGVYLPKDDLNARTLIDLGEFSIEGVEDHLVHEFRDFMRRRGIRLGTKYWHYDLTKGLRR